MNRINLELLLKNAAVPRYEMPEQQEFRMRTYLKIKNMSLAQEIRIIRAQERKMKGKRWKSVVHRVDNTMDPEMPITRTDRIPNPRWRPLLPEFAAAGEARSRIFWGLRRHRLIELRPEARAGCLAYGFLRGRPYKVMEAKAYTKPDWAKVERLAMKYGGDEREVKQRFQEWKDAAEAK